MVVVISAKGRSIALGLGREESVVQYQAADDPPYYASIGVDRLTGLVLFDYGGQETEFDRRHAVAIADARHAVAEFARTDQRPRSLKWELV
jgi:hypothetical protein